MGKKPSSKKIVNWIKDHVTPYFEWISKPDTTIDGQKIDDKFEIDNFKEEVKEKLIFGVKIKWRF